MMLMTMMMMMAGVIVIVSDAVAVVGLDPLRLEESHQMMAHLLPLVYRPTCCFLPVGLKVEVELLRHESPPSNLLYS